MAHTAHKNQQEKKEYFDTEQQLQDKITILADLISKSKHFIAFTGAGISTSCGIPDYRSGANTVLKTGPGVWEKNALKLPNAPNKNIKSFEKALPSYTHMALVKLEQDGYLKYLISQNIDGLHLRSGFNEKKIAQVHGNRCLQKCQKCGSQFLRDFRVRQAKKVHSHETSRKCEKCKSILHDSIINFGENLPQYQLNRSFQQGQKADLCLSLGSSLSVTPAADVPKIIGKKGKLIIVNLQQTPLDKYAYLRINGMCDDIMKRLCAKLNLKVDNFMLKRLIKFDTNKNEMKFRGIDRRGVPYTFFKQVSFKSHKDKVYTHLKKEPYVVSLLKNQKFTLKFDFYQFLGQPSVTVQFQKGRSGLLKMLYDPYKKQWIEKKWLKEQEQQPQIKKQIKQINEDLDQNAQLTKQESVR